MSDKSNWMPSDEEINATCMADQSDQFFPVQAIDVLIRGAVEKALAEREEQRSLDIDLAKMYCERLAEELRVLKLAIHSDKARHKREVIEARIATLEEAARAVCVWCQDGHPINAAESKGFSRTHTIPHAMKPHTVTVLCHASAIHDLIAAMESEASNG